MTDLSEHNLGRYRILERLGEGGMATVYKAYDSMLEREVAIKIIRREAFPPEMLHDVLKRFEREAKSLARLSHPNIVKVLDFGEHDGSPFLVLEYLSGGTLKQKIGTAIPWQEAVRLLLPIARGLEYAHRRGVIHRDIKPANILMTDDNEPTLSDFGIAKIFGGEQTTNLTGSGMAIGTPEYMAPEQWTGDTSAQSDIYAFGIVLYEFIAGRKPYVADTPGGILIKQVSEPLPLPRAFVPDLPEAVETVLLKALAKDRQDRYENMHALIEALENLLSDFVTRPVVTKSIASVQLEASAISVPQDSGETILPGDQTSTIAAPTISTTDEHLITRKRSSVSLHFSRRNIIIGIGAMVIFGLILVSLSTFRKMFATVPGPTVMSTQEEIKTFVSPPALTNTSLPPSATVTEGLTSTPSITPTPLPTEFMDAKGVSMRLVPAGNFTMGSDNGLYPGENPAHSALVYDFYMDKYEVTNALYAACVQAGACQPPKQTNSATRSVYYGNSQFDNYPVIYVNWYMAETYCEWRGARLPTEGEWEKAARGTDARIYPWGEGLDCAHANYSNCVGDTTAVGSLAKGVSPYGIYDLAGNVWEWVYSLYHPYPYRDWDGRNDVGVGGEHIVRGGSWENFNEYDQVNSSFRMEYTPAAYNENFGFRCALSADTSRDTIPTRTPTPTLTSTAIAAVLPTETVDAKGVVMMLIPSGNFTMGSTIADPDESPRHTVYLDSFYMDKFEVTNVLYRACVAAGVCQRPAMIISHLHDDYYLSGEFNNYPVVYIDWDRANTYCQWRGARLPTEAEWEKAAHGTDGRTYPWGNNIDLSYANYNAYLGVNETTRVGAYPKGKSIYGVYDLAGNVSEWVADWYSDTYYQGSPLENPLGPLIGGYHVKRGGDWRDSQDKLRTSDRDWAGSSNEEILDVGFRCAKDAP